MWSCEACTLENSKDDARQCELCGTARKNNTSKGDVVLDLTTEDGPPPHQEEGRNKQARQLQSQHRSSLTQQMTLFGTKAASSASSSKKTDDSTIKTSSTAAAAATETTTQDKLASRNTASSSRKRKSMPSTTTSSEDSMPAAPTKSGFSLASLGTATGATSSLTVRSHVPYAVLQQEAHRNLQTIFGFPSLRNLQPSAVKCALEFKSQTIILNTGAGKSLCYQLPATVMGGVTFVISPLIALMLDQVNSLNQKGISAALISSSQTETQNRAILERLLGRPLISKQNSTSTTNNKNRDKDNKVPTQKQLILNGDKNSSSSSSPPLTLLYITPESIKTDSFRSILSELYKQRRIAMFAVDEAHCLSRYEQSKYDRQNKCSCVSSIVVSSLFCRSHHFMPMSPRFVVSNADVTNTYARFLNGFFAAGAMTFDRPIVNCPTFAIVSLKSLAWP
jgi:hypothetical protein